MTFQDLEACIAGSGRRSIASALIAFILDALDVGQDGVDLDTFQSHTRFVRNNVTTVASYLQLHGIIHVLYYRDGAAERQYEFVNNYGRWAKQHYRLSQAIIQLHRRE
ncbi:hypothetical protein ACQFN5_06445 [Klebsiella sp. WOUb02]|uniref:hypothetical protein n=1 Tax=Klebsiella sp. WOUb02 TaxID=3161071 RepID=UPI003CEA0224